jgi:hypothetical protein
MVRHQVYETVKIRLNDGVIRSMVGVFRGQVQGKGGDGGGTFQAAIYTLQPLE